MKKIFITSVLLISILLSSSMVKAQNDRDKFHFTASDNLLLNGTYSTLEALEFGYRLNDMFIASAELGISDRIPLIKDDYRMKYALVGIALNKFGKSKFKIIPSAGLGISSGLNTNHIKNARFVRYYAIEVRYAVFESIYCGLRAKMIRDGWDKSLATCGITLGLSF